jgi:hypothetical protein
LCSSILQLDPAYRCTLEEVKSHPFFAGVDWKAAAVREMTPPHIPALATPARALRVTRLNQNPAYSLGASSITSSGQPSASPFMQGRRLIPKKPSLQQTVSAFKNASGARVIPEELQLLFRGYEHFPQAAQTLPKDEPEPRANCFGCGPSLKKKKKITPLPKASTRSPSLGARNMMEPSVTAGVAMTLKSPSSNVRTIGTRHLGLGSSSAHSSPVLAHRQIKVTTSQGSENNKGLRKEMLKSHAEEHIRKSQVTGTPVGLSRVLLSNGSGNVYLDDYQTHLAGSPPPARRALSNTN